MGCEELASVRGCMAARSLDRNTNRQLDGSTTAFSQLCYTEQKVQHITKTRNLLTLAVASLEATVITQSTSHTSPHLSLLLRSNGQHRKLYIRIGCKDR
ncbi:hypothetical protein E2562_010594 [Oryza meyeriana var. granulata]|uniref:Uncharacterized protein n=1 Tax=Oryza meyeriana var. granulata TaxID=110450 RepID=A0A6G1BTE1_9ORYZ|nr:hypothetical protein E2562_010594 [Oryza meyeriana var. granulata]KAF0891606.1 hypothetical protein E2562_010594 [Oryza meyeriana var. granulata]KAF0891607.1 hypothetical protein E2562_010594 [Oryza meyeriana var. granulata]KAF0891608.1 hypothetical protein E2562_010594 [Oryza meyeriana var. granulata]